MERLPSIRKSDRKASLSPKTFSLSNNGYAGGSVIFKLSQQDIPFTTENFVLSFSHPNLYFHATTTYALLRMRGVPLGKRDFMGRLRYNRPG